MAFRSSAAAVSFGQRPIWVEFAARSSSTLHHRRAGNTSNNNNNNKSSGGGDGRDPTSAAYKHSQPFVKTRLESGEWDPKRRDPLYRPKFQSTAKILHADDFARRPKVGFTGEFENFHDAMVTLSHLGDKQQTEVYRAYLDFMLSVDHHAAGRTSHEYVYRVLAQKFKMTAERIAGIVLLKHNEERLKDEGVPMDVETQQFMDDKFNKEIADAYMCTGERPPAEFTEDPVGMDGSSAPDKSYVHISDLADMDKLAEQMTVREAARARLIIDGHIYKEDLDDEAVELPMDKATRKLLRQKERIAQQMAADTTVEEQRRRGGAMEPPWPTVSRKGKGKQRPRWRYVAQIVDTQAVRGKKSYVNNSPENTLVELDNELRPGTLADCKTVSWKPKRDNLDHLIEPVRKAWLDRTVRNQINAWGTSQRITEDAAEVLAAAEDENSSKSNEGVDSASDTSQGLETKNEEESLTVDAESETDKTEDTVAEDDSTDKSQDSPETNKDDGNK